MGILDKRRHKQSKNWRDVKAREFQDQSKNRDVHGSQNLDRGEIGATRKPTRERVLAVILAALIAVPGYGVGFILLLVWHFYQFLTAHGGVSFLEFTLEPGAITSSWFLYAWTLLVFVLAWLIINEKLMMGYRAKNSMVDTADINTYENDQYIMLPEEAQEAYGWFPDAGAHSSIQVSSMLSHTMLDKKGLKRVDVVQRYDKDTHLDDGTVAKKGEVIFDADGEPVKRKMPLIDMDFGQELFTASGIPPSQKKIRTPVPVKGIEYNPVDDSGDRKDREKLPYDTVADLINEDWEFPEYEVQRPAGAYLVDTAPVNTMV